jgi:hypothetical protein
MIYSILTVLSLTLMIIAYHFRRPAPAFASAISWLLFGLYSYGLSLGIWDIYYDLMILGVMMFLVAIMEGYVLRPKPQEQDSSEDYYGRDMEDYATRRQNSRIWKDYLRTIANGDSVDIRTARERQEKLKLLRASKRQIRQGKDEEWRED